jgi:two-component system chemotaxis sensor kinase CheA
VIIGSDGHEIGLVVDELLGEDDIVIKSLAENYRNVEGVAGASILGNGRVSLILDVGAIVARASQAAPVEIAG